MTLIVLFNLKDGSAAELYEQWAQTVDVPTVKRLQSIDDFKVFKTSGVLGSESSAPYQYVEIIEVNDTDQLGKDISSDEMQKVAAQFQAFADNPCFMIASQFA
jgi:hypothetical protein